MLTTSFSELRRKAKKYFDAVEQGEMVHVTRRGYIIARIVPAKDETKPSWKKPAMRLIIPGVEISKMITEEREESKK